MGGAGGGRDAAGGAVVTHVLTLAAPSPERAVYGLVATTDAGAALLAQLEAQLVGARRSPLRPEAAHDAIARTGSVRGAAKLLGCARSTVRAAAQRTGVSS